MSDKSKKEDYTIYPLLRDPDSQEYQEVGENLLKPPFVYGLIGTRFVGKTNLIMTMVMRGFPFYLGAFDRIILISGTMKFDSSTRALVDYIGEENCFDTYSDGIIQALVEHNKALPKQLREKILIIGDDLPSLNLPMNAEIYKGTAYMRHLGISLILVTQILRGVGQGLPPIVRNQLEGVIIFRNSNQKQLNNIFEEMGHFGSTENIEAMYNDVVRGVPYNFLYLNSRTLKCYKNFDEEIWSMYDENGNYNPSYVEFKNKNKKKSLIENGSTSSEIIPK